VPKCHRQVIHESARQCLRQRALFAANLGQVEIHFSEGRDLFVLQFFLVLRLLSGAASIFVVSEQAWILTVQAKYDVAKKQIYLVEQLFDFLVLIEVAFGAVFFHLVWMGVRVEFINLPLCYHFGMVAACLVASCRNG